MQTTTAADLTNLPDDELRLTADALAIAIADRLVIKGLKCSEATRRDYAALRAEQHRRRSQW